MSSALGYFSMKILDHFEKVVVINMDERRDRLDRMQERLASFAIPFERHPAIKSRGSRPFKTNGQLGCFLSHTTLWNNIFNSSFNKPVLILEDDCLFRRDFLRFVPDFINFLQYVDWDIAYLGCVLAKDIKFKITKMKNAVKVAENVIKIDECWGTHAYFINPASLNFLTKIFPALIKLSWIGASHLDGLLNLYYPQLNRYVVYPTLVIQENGFSNVSNKHINREKEYDQSFWENINDSKPKQTSSHARQERPGG